MFFKSFLSLLLIVQVVLSSPVEKRAGEIQCASKAYNTGGLLISPAPEGGYPYNAVIEQTSSGGQHQLALSTDKNANQLQVIVRQCNSTSLDLHYRETYYPGGQPVKVFLANDETKCLQRFAALHSNEPSAKTHIIIGDCSNEDIGTIQAKQFWDQYLPYGTFNPLVVRNGKEQDLDLVLSNGDSGVILAQQFPSNSQSYQGEYVFSIGQPDN